MSNKRLVVTLAAAALVFARISAYAEAPVITNPPDVIIGDLEQGAANNVFIFGDAIDLDKIVADDNTAVSAIKWSYTGVDGEVAINGASQLSGGNPNAPGAGEDIRQTDNDVPSGIGEDGLPNTITFRNTGLSPGFGSLGPYGEPATTGVLASETRTLTLYASDGSSYSQTTITVYTANNTSDSISGGNLLIPLVNLDFVNDPNAPSGWLGGVLGGMGTTAIATGLCMGVPFGSDPGSYLGWVSPPNIAPGPNFIQLVDKAVYRTRLSMYTNTTADSAIPYWDWQYSNFVLSLGDGNSYGGLFWMLDVAGGATGIGRYQSDFDFWMTPCAALTAQWRGVVDPTNSAFDPSVDFKNDFSFTLRVLHDNSAINTNADGGTICMTRLQVHRAPLDQLTLTPLENAPIVPYNSGGIFFRDPDDFGTPSNPPGGFNITGGHCDIQLTGDPSAAGANGLGARKKLLFWDQSQPSGNQQFFPVVWQKGKIYLTQVLIRSNVGGAAGTVEGTDPADAIFVDHTVPTSEMGTFNWTTKGSANNFLRAASPRLTATTTAAGAGGAQPYIGLIAGTEPSKGATVGLPDSDRIRGYIDFFNTGALAPLGTTTDGLDPLTVEGMTMYEVDSSVLQ